MLDDVVECPDGPYAACMSRADLEAIVLYLDAVGTWQAEVAIRCGVE